MHGLLRCNINAGVRAHGWSGCVTQRCHNSPDGKRGYRVRVTSRTKTRGGFGGFWKSQLVELSPALGEDGWLSLSREGLATGAHVLAGGRWKSQNRKNVYLSPYVEEPLNSKVIKSFVPELRSRKCFSCFEIPMFYVYMLWTFYVHFTYCRIWIWYIYIYIYIYIYHDVKPLARISLTLSLSLLPFVSNVHRFWQVL